jgi:hypothetical protein
MSHSAARSLRNSLFGGNPVKRKSEFESSRMISTFVDCGVSFIRLESVLL